MVRSKRVNGEQPTANKKHPIFKFYDNGERRTANSKKHPTPKFYDNGERRTAGKLLAASYLPIYIVDLCDMAVYTP